MTTEELEKKLKISENTCIHCPTLELAKQVLIIFHNLGLKWCSGNSYIICTNWDYFKGNTIYCPFNGAFSSLEAQLTGYKIINAEEFIPLHTEEEEFDLENYTPKGELEGFPKEIIAHMLECQKEQVDRRDVTVFENLTRACPDINGFSWNKTKEGYDFWEAVIEKRNFDLFFERYPKQDNQYNSQEFNLENYTPKGQLTGFPKEIIAKMLDYQEKQGYPRDVSVFEEKIYAGMDQKGFGWKRTKDGLAFWEQVILQRDFNLFFERYPKQKRKPKKWLTSLISSFKR